MRRIVQSGVSLWRRLCSLTGALLDDDDDDDDDILIQHAISHRAVIGYEDGNVVYVFLRCTAAKTAQYNAANFATLLDFCVL